MRSFDPLREVRDELRASMERRQFAELTAVQRAVVDHGDTDANLRISSQTGSGKTVAIGIALADDVLSEVSRPRCSGPVALLIAPTRELAQQLGEELRWLYEEVPPNLSVLTGGQDLRREQRRLARGPQVVVGTPGRLLDHLRRGALELTGLRHVVLDEADRMLDMGFRDELEAIVGHLPAERRSHLVSATFPRAVQRFAERFQGEAIHIEGTRLGAAHEDIDHVAQTVEPRDRYDALVNALLMALGQRCLVFVARRTQTTEIAERLRDDGFSAMALSGELPQAQRTRTLEAFRRGQVDVVVATDVAARGLDVADVALVVHFDPPTDSDGYTHRSGRTGRAGRKGTSLSLVAPREARRLQRRLSASGTDVRWAEPPTVEAVEKAVAKEARRKLHQELASAGPPAEEHRQHARRLLEGHDDPTELVAQLLAERAPVLPTTPRSVRSPAKPKPRERARHQEQAPRADDHVAFHVSWGRNHGASKRRVLALICRRGDVGSAHVGRISVGPTATKVEVDRAVADGFAQCASKPDPRDPRVRIHPWRGQPPRAQDESRPPRKGRSR